MSKFNPSGSNSLKAQELSREELSLALGGRDFKFWLNNRGANFDNSDAYRNGIVQFGGAVGTALVTTATAAAAANPVGLVVGGIVVAGSALAAGDAHHDIQNARPDATPPDEADDKPVATASEDNDHSNNSSRQTTRPRQGGGGGMSVPGTGGTGGMSVFVSGNSHQTQGDRQSRGHVEIHDIPQMTGQ